MEEEKKEDEVLVRVQNLSKSFPGQKQAALQKINATFFKGKIVGVVGPDGAGKTTFMRLLAGLLKPSEGEISVCGYDTIKKSEFVHYLTGYMPQRFGLYEDLTVLQNLTLYADLKGVLGKDRKESFEKILHFTTLGPFIDRLAKALSGGMKQKLGLGCAIIKSPSLLLLDEPSVGVDPVSRRELWKMVNHLAEEGMGVVWSTSYLDEAERCQVVILLNQGEVCFNGDPTLFTAKAKGLVFKVSSIKEEKRKLLFRILKEENVIDGTIQGDDLRLIFREKSSREKRSKGVSIPARFEDAYMVFFGGVNRGEKPILADNVPMVHREQEEMIKAENLSKVFGKTFIAADQINFAVKKGEIFGLLGPNGSGKSTIFKMLCGLLKPTTGRGFINGKDLREVSARAQIGYMAQKFSLYDNLNVGQNLIFFSGIYGLKGDLQRKSIDQMIEIFSLNPYLSMLSGDLPLGIKQRLALACANMHYPKVLFLDEPTSGVDPITRREFWTQMNGLVAKGVTIMVTTHFMDEAEYCDRIALIYRGKIIQMDTPTDLKKKSRSTDHPNPSLEETFIQLIENYDKTNR